MKSRILKVLVVTGLVVGTSAVCWMKCLPRRVTAKEACLQSMAEMEKGFLILGAVEIGNGRWSFPKPNSNQVACQQFSRDGQITFKTVLNNKRKSSVRIFYNHGRRLVEEVDWEGDGIADLMIVFDENGQALDAIERNKKGLMEQMDQERLMELKKIFSVQSKN